MKKALKLIAVLLGGSLLVFVILVLLFIKSLPSTWEIKQKVSPKAAQKPEFSAPTVPADAAKEKPLEKPAVAKAKTQDDRIDEGKELSARVLLEDFLNEQKPLSSVCAQLGQAPHSRFLRKDHSGSAKEFMKSFLEEDAKDPLAESAAPLFRYVFRLENMKELIGMVENAQVERDEGLFKKTEFYTKLGLAAQELREQKPALDRLLMKSYNLFILARAVGQHPELARDPASLQYCEQLEKNLNLHLEFNAEEQARELQKFLDYARITPEELDYDPEYRSDLKFNYTNKSLAMNQIWIEKLFAKDIQKAQQELIKQQKQGATPDGF